MDPFQRLVALPDVAAGLERARTAVDRLLAHRFLRTDAGAVSVAAGERAARASAQLDGLPLAPALTLQAETGVLATTWGSAPRQALARMHVLASEPGTPDVGQPRRDAVVSARLEGLFQAIEHTSAPAVVVSGVLHAEVAALEVFGSRDALVARAAARAVLVSSGYDPRALIPFEAGYDESSYADALAAYRAGDAVGWLARWCDAIVAGAAVAVSVCDELRAARG
jgi:hypothetical protein